MITPSFSPTATERVLPKLALDFTTASLDSRVTFTRTTGASNPATYVNSSGLITAATNNQPRFDYSTTSVGTCNGLLIEESRTNLITYSEDMSNGAWKYNAPLALSAADVVVAPTGVQNADRLSTTNAGSVYQDVAITGTNTHTISCFVHTSSTCTNLAISAFYISSTFASFNITVNPSTGAVISSTGTTYGSQNYGNGWYRFWATKAGTSAADTTLRLQLYDNTTSANTLVVWGAQVEVGAFPTSYIPTTSAALTRNADVATMTGTNFSSWFNASEGACVVNLIPKSTSSYPYLTFDDVTTLNSISIANSSTSGQSKLTTLGVLQTTLTAGTIATNSVNKVGCSWVANNCAATANAASPATTATALIPTVSELRIGSNGTNYANSWIQSIKFWKQRIVNNEIQAFTK